MSADDHGSDSTYVNYRCRCAACRSAHASSVAGQQARRRTRLLLGEVLPEHGQYSTYINYRCRCDECSAARAEYDRQHYLAKRSSDA